ncbi:MAG: 50S ribosome-binding GTPase, partial [Planctomycetes bacterium]|nr:50S ribosome-binding GTPase [Planctomycetota bacterium]
MSGVPVFVVVGNVNQGKSSVVAALSENETIPIDSYPGTTAHAGVYVFRAGERELFRVVDTPGFQRARQVLDWLRRHASSAAERPRAVRAFVEAHRGATGGVREFADEVELLAPILDGAGILYVVDASSHLEPSNEAEMEILRWTGQPAMALINRVRQRDHAAEWRPTLTQFFHIVREFDAHGASFAERTALLRGFREIRPEWSA